MPKTLQVVPCLQDNYAFLVTDDKLGLAALIDAPEAAPIHRAIEAGGNRLDLILLTHHHDDHIQAARDLSARHGAKIWGAAADAHRLPPLDRELTPGETVAFLGDDMHVLDVSGHTVGHLAFHVPAMATAFTADSLMALGCGRLFEGTPEMMWDSLSRLAALPDDTIICSGHEYTAANARFALTIEPDNPDLLARVNRIAEARAKGLATVPSTLAEELATNPFLRANLPHIKKAMGLADAPDATVFAEIRGRKDRF